MRLQRARALWPVGRSIRSVQPDPARSATVLLASEGREFSDESVKQALVAAEGGVIRVLSIAKIYGVAMGLQHPGLLPSKREMAAQEEIVASAIRRIEAAGGNATGEVVATRENAKSLARAARRCSVSHAVLEPQEPNWLRRLVEGDTASRLRRYLGPEVEIHVVGGS